MLIVTPNPAVDHTVHLAALRPGEVIRTGPGASAAGGKGGNVSRAATCLGARPAVLAPVPEAGGDHLRALFAAESLELIAVPVPGRVRTCTVLLEDDGRVTLLNEPGAPLAPADWDRLVAALAATLDARADTVVVCSGSLPPGAPPDAYAQVVRMAHAGRREVLVDIGGQPLALAIDAGADLVCPNLSEAESVLAGGPVAEAVQDGGDDVPVRARAAASGLHERGAAWAVVTAGSAGAAVAGPGAQYWLRAPTVAARNPIGAGDSFLAGVATARESGAEWPAAIRRGLAAGSASVEQPASGVVDPSRVRELERLVV